MDYDDDDDPQSFTIQEMYALLRLMKKLQAAMGYTPAPFFRHSEDLTREFLEFATGGPDSRETRVSVHEMQDAMIDLKGRGRNMPPNNVAPFLCDKLEETDEEV